MAKTKKNTESRTATPIADNMLGRGAWYTRFQCAAKDALADSERALTDGRGVETAQVLATIGDAYAKLASSISIYKHRDQLAELPEMLREALDESETPGVRS